MPAKKSTKEGALLHFALAFWDSIILLGKGIYHVVNNLLHLLVAFVKLALLAIVGFALAIFLFTLSLFFLTRAFTLTEDSEWAQLRHKTIQIIDTELDFGLNWLRLQNAATLPNLKDTFFGTED